MIVLKGPKRLSEGEGNRSPGIELEWCEPWDMGVETSDPQKGNSLSLPLAVSSSCVSFHFEVNIHIYTEKKILTKPLWLYGTK